MSNNNYDYARVAFATAQIDWLNHNIKAAVLSPLYTGGTIATTTEVHFDSIAPYVLTGGQPIVTLINKVTSVGSLIGALSADPVTFTALTANQSIGYIVIFKDLDITNINGAPALGNQTSSPLIALIDSGYGIGAGTNGYDMELTWDTVNGITRL